MSFGLIELPWWGYILVTLALTHVTIASVTIFLHRCQAHRGLELHPIASHFFRFWLWLTTGTNTKQWAAVHRKHHAKCETIDDPHSPQVLGIKKVFFEGYELYKNEIGNQETIDKFGAGTPDDWLEHHVYAKYTLHGIVLMLLIDLALFGSIGITMWAVQMLWIPVTAAGIINGIGHYWGYRNFAAEDASRNIMPWGILIGGEELHNNHHAYASSAKLSNKWYEFDIGWFYIKTMTLLGLAKVKKIAPQIKFDWAKTRCDLDTLQAVITHRFDVMGQYGQMLKKAYQLEIRKLKLGQKHHQFHLLNNIKHRLHLDSKVLQQHDKLMLDAALSEHQHLKIIYDFKHELAEIWSRSSHTPEQLLKRLDDWCSEAEASGIQALEEFSQRLRCYKMA